MSSAWFTPNIAFSLMAQKLNFGLSRPYNRFTAGLKFSQSLLANQTKNVMTFFFLQWLLLCHSSIKLWLAKHPASSNSIHSLSSLSHWSLYSNSELTLVSWWPPTPLTQTVCEDSLLYVDLLYSCAIYSLSPHCWFNCSPRDIEWLGKLLVSLPRPVFFNYFHASPEAGFFRLF